jgi:hypothetical protein
MLQHQPKSTVCNFEIKSHMVLTTTEASIAQPLQAVMGSTKSSSDVSVEDASGPVDFSKEVDVEKNGRPDELQRQVTGPPYSIWSKGAKIWIIFLVSVSALISPFGATTFLPALNVLTGVLHITPTQVNISVTTYMVR